MEQVLSLISWLLVVLPVAAAARIVYCLCCIPTDGDNESSYKKRIRNTLIFVVLAETVMGLLRVVAAYY